MNIRIFPLQFTNYTDFWVFVKAIYNLLIKDLFSIF